MVRIMYLSPVAHRAGHDEPFAGMARNHRLEGTEVHVTSLPDDAGRFSHIEYRSYGGMVTGGIIRAVRQAASEGFDALAIGCFYDTAPSEAREITASLCNRFGVIVGQRKWVDQMQASVHVLGHSDRLAGSTMSNWA